MIDLKGLARRAPVAWLLLGVMALALVLFSMAGSGDARAALGSSPWRLSPSGVVSAR